jgi:hypothetical protein
MQRFEGSRMMKEILKARWQDFSFQKVRLCSYQLSNLLIEGKPARFNEKAPLDDVAPIEPVGIDLLSTVILGGKNFACGFVESLTLSNDAGQRAI